MSAIQSKKIIHCDCDCFYAAIEIRDNPQLHGLPVAVGGDPTQRGVIATCNYEARRFGVRSAMASAYAVKLCPSLLIIPPSLNKYREASEQIMNIYQDYTERVEPLSLDEAYLDVSESSKCGGSATLIAKEIRARVFKSIGITISSGVAPNKFLAKIASGWKKPNGLFVIRPDEVEQFVAQLPVENLFGVGKVTASRLKALGIITCHDLRAWSLSDLLHLFGSFGQQLYELCRGIDSRQVTPDRESKSISVETTYIKDLTTADECWHEVQILIGELEQRIQQANASHLIRKLFIKIKYDDFNRTTTECIYHALNADKFKKLLDVGLLRRKRAIRLLGVGVRFEQESNRLQLPLFDSVDIS